MPDPTLAVRLPVQLRTLDVNAPVRRIKIDIPDRGRPIIDRISITHALKEGRTDEIHVLSCVREQPGHDKGDEATCRSRVVVSREAGQGVIEYDGDEGGVKSLGGKTGTAGVVVEIGGQEGGLVAEVGESGGVEIV